MAELICPFPLVFSLVCMAYMTSQLYHYLMIDTFGYLPSVGYWFVGLFLTFSVWMIFINAERRLQGDSAGFQWRAFILLNLLYMAGLTGLVLIY